MNQNLAYAAPHIEAAALPAVSSEDMELIDALSGEVEELLVGVEEKIRELHDYVFALPYEPADYTLFLAGIDVSAYLEALRGINRFVHTIKGNAGFMQLNRLKTYCHRLEELTLGIMEGRLFLEHHGYRIIEKVPDVVGRFFQRLSEVYCDADVPIEAELNEIQKVREDLEVAVGDDPIQLSSFQKQDLGLVRKSKKSLKVSMDLATLDRVAADYQVASYAVGELLEAAGVESDKVSEVTRMLNDHLEHLLVAAQDRMVLTRYQRIVRDLSKALGKEVDFCVTRNAAQARPDVWDHCHNAMVHLVRNAVDHGIELPEARVAAGKPPRARIELALYEDHKSVYIRLTDDGAGIDPRRVGAKAVEKGVVSAAALQAMSDPEIQKLIFRAGFSTREQATDVSGRGVGMDAVLKEIEGSLGGRLALESTPGRGTAIHIEIPKSETLAECILFGDEDRMYAIPKVQEVSYVDCDLRRVESFLGNGIVYTGGDHSFPVLPILAHLEPERGGGSDLRGHTIIRLGTGERRFGLAVPAVFGHRRMKVERNHGWDGFAGCPALVYGYGVTDPVTVVLDVEQLEELALTSLG